MTKRILLISISLWALAVLGLYKAFNDGQVDQPWGTATDSIASWLDKSDEFASSPAHLTPNPVEFNLVLSIETPNSSKLQRSIDQVKALFEFPSSLSDEIVHVVTKSRLPDAI